jgi:hypothetical protein
MELLWHVSLDDDDAFAFVREHLARIARRQLGAVRPAQKHVILQRSRDVARKGDASTRKFSKPATSEGRSQVGSVTTVRAGSKRKR